MVPPLPSPTASLNEIAGVAGHSERQDQRQPKPMLPQGGPVPPQQVPADGRDQRRGPEGGRQQRQRAPDRQQERPPAAAREEARVGRERQRPDRDRERVIPQDAAVEPEERRQQHRRD